MAQLTPLMAGFANEKISFEKCPPVWFLLLCNQSHTKPFSAAKTSAGIV
jgi:hypothetical protein